MSRSVNIPLLVASILIGGLLGHYLLHAYRRPGHQNVVYYEQAPEKKVDVKTNTPAVAQQKDTELDPLKACTDAKVWPTPQLKKVDLTQNFPGKDLECIDCNPDINTLDGPVIYKVCLYDDKKDQTISLELRKGLTYESEGIQVVAQFLINYPDFGFVDIGANIGLYTLMAAKLGRPVLAVEPRHENILRLHRAISDAKYTNVHIYQNAVSRVRTTMHLLTWGARQTKTKVVCKDRCDGITDTRESCNNQTVDSVYLDDLIPAVQKLDVKKVVVKIDTDSHDYDILAQSEELFKTLDVAAVILSWKDITKQGEAKAQAVVDFFQSHNYVAYSLLNGRKRQVKPWKAWLPQVCWIKRPYHTK